MRTRAPIASCLVAFSLAACASPSADERCADAVAHVRSCLGPDDAEEFAATCTPARAEQALAYDCSAVAGKGDGSDGTTCTALHVGCDGTNDPTDEVENFKYGSIGSDAHGIPLLILQALPRICPDLLPVGGVDAFGFITEPGHDLPIRLSRRRVANL